MSDFFTLNRPIILFVYGQVFFTLGFAIFLQSRHHSQLKLARDLRWLAVFGLLHGLHEWSLVFIPIQAQYVQPIVVDYLQYLALLLLALSFVCLLMFACATLLLHSHTIYWISTFLSAACIVVATFFYHTNSDQRDWYNIPSILARYLIGFPGAILAGYSLYTLSRSEPIRQAGQSTVRMLQVTSLSLVIYAFLSGAITRSASFFPANFLNQDKVYQEFNVPVEVFRSLCGLVLALSMIRALEIFEIEIERLIETMEVETVQAAERERIGQELHDGAMQSVYAIGLILNSVAKRTADNPELSASLAQAQKVLQKAVVDLRGYMASLRMPLPERSFVEELQDLANEPHFRSLIHVRLILDDVPPLTPKQTGHLLAIAREGLSNVVKHAEANEVLVHLFEREGDHIFEICDNGRGFEENAVQAGFGLNSMRDYAAMMGATLQLQTTPGKGTTLTLELPANTSGRDT